MTDATTQPAELTGNPPTFDMTPTSRAYVHTGGCAGVTVVGEDSFEHLCDPFYRAPGTICANCNSGRPFSEFTWEDTGENVQAYRTRLWGLTSPEYRRGKKRVLYAFLALIVVWAIGANFARWWAGAFFIGLLLGIVAVVVVLKTIPKPPAIDFRKYK